MFVSRRIFAARIPAVDIAVGGTYCTVIDAARMLEAVDISVNIPRRLIEHSGDTVVIGAHCILEIAADSCFNPAVGIFVNNKIRTGAVPHEIDNIASKFRRILRPLGDIKVDLAPVVFRPRHGLRYGDHCVAVGDVLREVEIVVLKVAQLGEANVLCVDVQRVALNLLVR